MSEDSMALTEIQQACGIQEEMGLDAPFTTFTWERWLKMEAQMVQGLARFQRAIERREVQLALLIVLEMQEIGAEMQKEVCAWVGSEKQ